MQVINVKTWKIQKIEILLIHKKLLWIRESL